MAEASGRTRVLLAGKSWTSAATHIKGFDQFPTVSFHLGAEPLVAALAGSAFELTYMKAHEAAAEFPLTRDALDAYAAVILSDLGANTLLLHPDVWFKGQPVPNRLRLLRDWVAGGGALMMIGGYYSFQGINGGARYHRTPVEEVLPVDCLPYDDRVEVPEGFRAELLSPTIRSSPGSARRGRCCSAATRSASSSASAWSCWPSCRTTRAATRCWSPAPTARAARSPGPRTSARTGCRRASPTGRATRASGARRWPG